jgi:hypothetical protein
MRRFEAAHYLDDGIEGWLVQQLLGGEQRRRCAPALRVRHGNGFQVDRPAGGLRDPIGILHQPSRQRAADVAKAEQSNAIRGTHSGTLPSPP